jgi:hypothetical protein
VRVRLVTRFFAVPLALAALFALAARPSLALVQGPSCGEQTVQNNKGVTIKILFAKNGAVQRYLVIHSRKNVEAADDFVLALTQKYGEAGIAAPPLHIISFKPGSGGMQIPDKAIDSCGRKVSFQ